MHVSRVSEYMRISGFMHGITNPDLIKKLNNNIPKSVDKMMNVTTAFLRREVAEANQSKKKVSLPRRHHETNHRPNFDKRLDFKSQYKSSRRQDRFTPLTETPKEIMAMETVKFKAPPPMTGPAKNQNKTSSMSFTGIRATTRTNAKRACKGHQERRSSQQRESYSDLHGLTLATDNKVEGHLKLLCRPRNLFPTPQSSPDAQVPSGGRHIDNPKQHHNTSGMQNGSRSTKRTSTSRTKDRERNQSSNPPRVSRTDSHDRRKSIRKRKNRTLQFAQRQLRHIFLEIRRYDRRSKVHSETSLEYPRRMPAHKAKKKGTCTGQKQGNPKGSCQTCRSRSNERSALSRLALKPGHGEKARRKLADMAGEDEEKMAFHTSQGVFCYTKMSFGLKNARATYQRLIDKAFEKQIGQNLEVYVDDLVIKSHTELEILRDVKETFLIVSLCGVSFMILSFKFIFGDLTKNNTLTGSVPGLWEFHGLEARLILTNPKGEEFTYALRFEFDASNNEAEYEALIAGLRIAEQMGLKNLLAKVDSRLVANQINGSYEAKNHSMIQYLGKAKALTDNFKMFSIAQVPRSENKKADALNKIASTSFTHLTKQNHGYGACSIQAEYAVKEIHEGSCSMHSGPRDNPFKDWCEKLNIKQRFASVKHPQTNGQVERANRILGEGIKARLGEDNMNWVEEVPHVLWAHHTMIKTSNEDTLFSLTYGTEAMIPVEIGMPSLRCAKVNQAKNDKGLLPNLDMLEEKREMAVVREARSKAKMEKYYNARVRSTAFRPGDFVYRSNEASNAKNSGKLGPKWEGPYEVVKALRRGA
uniref:Reverse transcriptase domain-containing protein n=1 Tax=Tanacetum cinerariifolium TaxID=118510 RepID=A0A6L2JPK6_TANCI|nr:reverse transcriptase domain-containing protein [Tanacetum cinerariifolium]